MHTVWYNSLLTILGLLIVELIYTAKIGKWPNSELKILKLAYIMKFTVYNEIIS